jgi:predicted nucleic acid-binding protein
MSDICVVIDTNIFVAAGFSPASRSARVIQAVRDGRVRLRWNDATRGEAERIVTQIPPLSWRWFADLFAEADRFDGATDPGRFEVVPDPSDRHFAALAEATGATLVTLDDHLLRHRDAAGIPIVTPEEFWEQKLVER